MRSAGRFAVRRAVASLYHVRSQATPTIIKMPNTLTAICIGIPGEISTFTKCAAKARNTPRQKISSECCPHRIAGLSQARFQRRPVARHEIDRDRRQREEMREAQHVEIGLVDRIDMVGERLRHQRRQPRNVPGQRDAEGEHQIGDRDRERDARMQQAVQLFGAAERAPGAEHEQQLPGERIEKPGAARIGRQVPAEFPGQRIEHDRERERHASRCAATATAPAGNSAISTM